MYKYYIKRVLDLILSFVAIVLLSPLLIVISLVVLFSLGRPILFQQVRIGKNEKQFNMMKFRTMTNKTNYDGKLLPDKERITKVGSFLRSSSLDELPELFNILKGDLSIVGPRPLLAEYLPYYTEMEKKRHSVNVGLIPPEVLYDKVLLTWKEQFKYDIYYVDNLSFLLDVKMLFYAVKNVLQRNKMNYGEYVRKSLVEERKTKDNI